MSEQTKDTPNVSAAEQIVAETESGARNPGGKIAVFLAGVCIFWSLWQIWISSSWMGDFGHIIPPFIQAHIRPIHVALAMFLAFLSYPALKSSPRDRIPIQDWVFAIVGACSVLYLAVFYREIAERPGLPTTADVVSGVVGLVFLLEATRRALGPPLMIVALVFLMYIFFGEYAPDVVAWKGASLNKAMSHVWITSEGVFGVAAGVSAGVVFLFVLFGSLLEKAGAGNYFIQVSFSLMGHLRGGPAKAAVVASAMTGLISGSSIANVVTTGTFTIPLMKKVGFSAEKAGAVEVASSTNGQLTPPIMGAAAFLMIEFVGISYIEVITHAFLPAIISYIALVYIVHLEACKAGMVGLPRAVHTPFGRAVLGFLLSFGGMVILSGVAYYGFGWVKGVAGDATFYIATIILIVAHIGLIWFGAKFPKLENLAEQESITKLPIPGPTIKSGLYFLLPVVVLIWCLMVESLSPGLSAFWATLFMIFSCVTHRPLSAYFRGNGKVDPEMKAGFDNLRDGLIAGARNMIGIGVATAAAGIIVGAITLTGVGSVLSGVVEIISGGNLMLLLFFTAVICIILGMGLPTTANYIVVSALMAPVIVEVGSANGLIVPLIAVHMFVFYFGILADDTPPVGLAAYAAAAISHGDPIKTGIQGFAYDIRTAILPFMFIFNTELLMIGIEGPGHLALVIVTAVVAILLFSAATQGWFLTKNKIWETVAMLLIAFTLFRPGYWMDMIYAPLVSVPGAEVFQVAEELDPNSQIMIQVKGQDLEGNDIDKVVMLRMSEAATGVERLFDAGLELREEDGRVLIDNVVFGTAAEKQKLDFDWEIVTVQKDADRPAKHWMYIPALLLLGLVIVLQRRRAEPVPTAKPA